VAATLVPALAIALDSVSSRIRAGNASAAAVLRGGLTLGYPLKEALCGFYAAS